MIFSADPDIYIGRKIEVIRVLFHDRIKSLDRRENEVLHSERNLRWDLRKTESVTWATTINRLVLVSKRKKLCNHCELSLVGVNIKKY